MGTYDASRFRNHLAIRALCEINDYMVAERASWVPVTELEACEFTITALVDAHFVRERGATEYVQLKPLGRFLLQALSQNIQREERDHD